MIIKDICLVNAFFFIHYAIISRESAFLADWRVYLLGYLS